MMMINIRLLFVGNDCIVLSSHVVWTVTLCWHMIVNDTCTMIIKALEMTASKLDVNDHHDLEVDPTLTVGTEEAIQYLLHIIQLQMWIIPQAEESEQLQLPEVIQQDDPYAANVCYNEKLSNTSSPLSTISMMIQMPHQKVSHDRAIFTMI